MPEIVVHEKALAHLSRGLYRSPASALRELVSNAWDANATKVEISTNYPLFMRLDVQDNGDGFTRDEFERLMGGIGVSAKRPSGHALKRARPVIGRLGIGMLGIAQICGSFTVTSRLADGSGFRAIVTLYDLLKEKLDEPDSDLIKLNEEDGLVTVNVGSYTIDDDFDPQRARKGTLISTEDIHPTFVRTFQDSLKLPDFKPTTRDWRKAIKTASSVRSLNELGDYWKLIWELSASCPIPYVSEDALPRSLVKEDQTRLESYDFNVTVDSLELRKPVFLKGNSYGYTALRIEPQHFRTYSRDLRFHGYLVVQEGRQLRPDELRGILVRIKNVGIGYYDPAMLDYRINQGPRSRWLTGEIYVDEGLEDALNIDRDSFNRFHPQFKALQQYIHNVLDGVFSDVYRQIKVRSDRKAAQKSDTRETVLTTSISETVETRVSVRLPRTKAEREMEWPKLVERRDGVSIVMPDPTLVPTKRTHKQLALSILALFEIAMSQPASKRRDAFRTLLFALFDKW